MLSEATKFWDAISGKVKQLIRGETQNTMRCERYEVTTAPDGTQIGVTKAFGTHELMLPYSAEVSNAAVGDPVLVVWWHSMSNAKVYYFADGFAGSSGGGGGGGTSDYTDLTNKPQINGVTLSGNKTAAQLSLGTYTKPVSGIPASDLASAVQTSLGKADTALQSAPVTSVDGKTGAVTILPSGGSTGQVLQKKSNTDYDTEWITPSGSTTDVFWATKDVTTSAQIEAAYQAGKLCCVEYNNRIYLLVYRTSATKHGFRVVDGASQEGVIYSINCISDVWSTSTLTLARSSDIPSASSATPQALGTAAPGSSSDYSRADHVHENNIFWCTKDVTTSAQIEAAYQAGKTILWVNGSGYVHTMTERVSETKHIFVCCRSGTVWSLTVNSDVWGSAGQRTLLQTSTSNPKALGTASPGSSSNVSKYDHVHPMPSASDVGAEPAVTEVTVSTAGAVTQALDAGKIYHFTGAITSLTITLNAAGTGIIPQYHFDFESGSTAPTVTLPGTVTMQGGTFTPEASKHYEVDILNGYGVYMAW